MADLAPLLSSSNSSQYGCDSHLCGKECLWCCLGWLWLEAGNNSTRMQRWSSSRNSCPSARSRPHLWSWHSRTVAGTSNLRKRQSKWTQFSTVFRSLLESTLLSRDCAGIFQDSWEIPQHLRWILLMVLHTTEHLQQHPPSLPQPSEGQSDVFCQTPSPVVESGTQARLTQEEFEHWPQQQCTLEVSSYLQSLVPTSVQGLPGVAKLQSVH